MSLAALRGLLSGRAIFTLLALFTLLRVQVKTFADDPGLGWHLALGRFIFEKVSLPIRDPFLHHIGEAPRWICDQWIADAFLYGLFQAGSWPAVYSVLLIVFLLSFFWLLCGFLRSSTLSACAALIATVVSFKLAQVHFIARPVIFNVSFLVLMYFLSRRMLERRTFSKQDFVIPLLLALWANVHGSFVVGLAISLFAASLLCLGRVFRLELKASLSCVLFAIGLFCSTLLTPYGIGLYENILSQVGSAYFVGLLEEWRPLALTSFEGRVFILVNFCIVLSLLGKIRKLAALDYYEYCVALGFAWFTLQHIRMLPIFAIVAALPFARSLDEIAAVLARKLPPKGLLVRFFRRIEAHETSAEPGAGFFAILSLLFFAIVFVRGELPLSTQILGPSHEKFPHAAVQYLRERSSATKERVVAAHPNWGGFITFYGENSLRAIIDDRNRMRGEKFYREFFAAMTPTGDWRSFLAEQEADYLLLETKSAYGLYLISEQTLPVCYSDSLSVLFALGEECP